ncbi:MAG: cupin domain-containing protein [Chitinophagaceae bacterium]|nr:cupin domain-containing protein [Chitinophagaceae bacterium]
MPFLKFDEIAACEIAPGFHSQLLHTGSQTLNFIEVDAGSEVPLHSHVHEQLSFVLEGQFEMTIAGEVQVLEPGRFCHIPSGVQHGGRALTHCRLLDVFTPLREDYKAIGGLDLSATA